jgi:hypothetical protein
MKFIFNALHLMLFFVFFLILKKDVNAQVTDTWHSENLLYSRTSNLVLNGSFESGMTGTQSTLLGGSPCNTGFPTSWASLSAFATTGLTSYITAGPQTMRLHLAPGACENATFSKTTTFPIVPPNGSKMVYMGNWTNVKSLPAISHNYNKGTIFPNGTNINQTSNMVSGEHPVDMTQTVAGLTAGENYGLEIWATNEDNDNPEGFFEVDITFLNASNVQVGTKQRVYFVVPVSGAAANFTYGVSERFYTEFTIPTGGTKAIISVVNYGHVNAGLTPNWAAHLSGFSASEEVTIDDIVMQKLLNVSGEVFVDANGNAVQSGTTEVGIDPNALSAVLTDGSGTIIQIVPVNADGTYTFTSAPANTSGLEVSIVPTSGLNSTRRGDAVAQQTEAIGTASWYYTGTNINGGTINQTVGRSELPEITFSTASSNISGLNFGINQPPTATSQSSADINNIPIGSTRYPLTDFGANLTLSGSDPQDGALNTGETMVITTIPDPTTEGILYYNGLPVTAGQIITNYNPTLMTFDPADRALASYPVNFTFQTRDAAGELSSPATISFTVATKVSISGNLFLDANGNAIEVTGNGIEPTPMYAVLTNAAGVVIQTVPLNTNGSFTFTNAPAGTSNLNVYVSTSNAAVGTSVTASTYPSGWVSTGVNVSNLSPNTSATKLTLTTTNVNMQYYNFGIESLPDSDSKSVMIDKPTSLQIIAGTVTEGLTGTDVEDGVYGNEQRIVITTLASNGTMYYNGVLVTVGMEIVNFNPLLLSFTGLKEGGLNTNFKYAYIDDAGKRDPSPATYTINWPPSLLPVELLSFIGEAKDCKVYLNWKTAAEVNFNHFEIERSLANGNFEKIESVLAKGSGSNYTFVDNEIVKNANYRLKMIDNDATFEYSPSVYIIQSCNRANVITLYPNPVRDNVIISSADRNTIGTTVKIYSTDGQLMIEKVLNSMNETIDMNAFAQGIYYIDIQDFGKYKIVKQ